MLRRCEHNWATAALVRRYMKNRRKNIAKARKDALAGAHYTIPDIDDEDMDGEGAGSGLN